MHHFPFHPGHPHWARQHDCASRRGGPFWFGRGGRPGGFAHGGPPGFDFRAGRKLSSADLQLLILSLLGEKGRHGYDLIKAIEERSRGFYVPSPGVIYPALTYLEEAEYAVAEAKGSRKLYELTELGRRHLEERKADADALLAQLDELGRRMGRVREAFADDAEEGEGDPFSERGWSARHDLRNVFRDLRRALHHHTTREQRARIVAILQTAVREIEHLFEEEPK